MKNPKKVLPLSLRLQLLKQIAIEGFYTLCKDTHDQAKKLI